MGYRRYSSWITGSLVVLLTLGVVPGIASAHDVAGSRFNAPLPLSLLFIGAGVTVTLTALWLAFTDRATTPSEHQRHLLTIPSSVAVPVRYGMQGLFLVAVLVALIFGFMGRQVAAENFATVFTWPVWFRGVALVAILFGNPWRMLSPWRTIYRGLVRLEGRTLAVLGAYPASLGAWPAFIGFIILIGIIENLTTIPRSPRLTTVIIAVYALVMISGTVLYGPSWLRQADPLGVLYRLFGRVASIKLVKTNDGGYLLTVRSPWQGCLDQVGSVPLVVFVIATVYTVSFDGFTNTRTFQTILFGMRDVIGSGPETSLLLYGVGLLGFVSTFGIGIWIVERLGASTARDWAAAARWFAPTVLPIAAAYEVAHNYPYVIRNFGQLLVIGVRWIFPGGRSLELLGWLSLPMFWGSQVVLIVLGHVIAVVAAHYIAVMRYDSVAAARRGHFPLVGLMVGYTILSLWIISQPVVSG